MTDLITEARELCERATPGKWHWEGELLLTDAEQFLVLKPYYDDDTDNVSTCVMPDDAAFIARSRTLIPELCDALEKAEAEIERLRELKAYFDELYGQGLDVMNWHINGSAELFDSFFDSALEQMNQLLPAAPEEGAEHE